MRGRKRATISATTGSSTAWRAGSGSGQAITLRTTSPQAASVVSSEALMPATSSRSSVLWTTWNCTPCRVVRRSFWSASSAIRSRASHCSGLITPPGTEARTMQE